MDVCGSPFNFKKTEVKKGLIGNINKRITFKQIMIKQYTIIISLITILLIIFISYFNSLT
jgi:uncharacterized membrane protein YvbJ